MYCVPAVSMIVSTQVSVTVSVTVSVVPVIRNTTCQKPAIWEGPGRFREDTGKQTGKGYLMEEPRARLNGRSHIYIYIYIRLYVFSYK